MKDINIYLTENLYSVDVKLIASKEMTISLARLIDYLHKGIISETSYLKAITNYLFFAPISKITGKKSKPINIKEEAEALKDYVNVVCISCIPMVDKVLEDQVKSIVVDTIVNDDSLVEKLARLHHIDNTTFGHSVRVAIIATALAIKMKLPYNQIKTITYGALLHDIGKIILMPYVKKAGPLTNDEFEAMKLHSVFGKDFCSYMNFPEEITDIVFHHHERINGKGYPEHLSEDKLSLNSQIVGISDVADALMSKRSYKSAFSAQEAVEILAKETFDFKAHNFSLFMKLKGLLLPISVKCSASPQ